MTEDEILDDLIRREGSAFTDRASDRGGPTKYGITLQTFREERGAYATAQDLKRLTEDEARVIYRQRYIRRPGFDRILDPQLRAFLIDFGVNSGPKRAVLALQAFLGVTQDGIIGVETITRLASIDAARTYSEMLRSRLRLYVELVLGDPAVKAFRAVRKNTQLENLRGWTNRLGEFF